MLIGELSKQTGVSVHTLRYYENLGLITGKTDNSAPSNNYKHYEEGLIEKLQWILAAKKAGFTLAEIKVLLQDWFGKKRPMDKKLAVVAQKINEVEDKIEQLQEVKRFLLQAKQEVEAGRC